MNYIKNILKFLILVLCVIIQVHVLSDTTNSLSPVNWIGLAFADNLYKFFPFCYLEENFYFIMHYIVFTLQSLITFLLICTLFKKGNLISYILSTAICIPIFILGFYIMEAHYKDVIDEIVSSPWGVRYYNFFGFYLVFYYVIVHSIMQSLLLCFYGISQLVFYRRTDLRDKFQWAQINWDWRELIGTFWSFMFD